jgi:hypothetical protein
MPHYAQFYTQIVGFVVDIIHRQSKEDLLECIPSTDGRIRELFVDSKPDGGTSARCSCKE